MTNSGSATKVFPECNCQAQLEIGIIVAPISAKSVSHFHGTRSAGQEVFSSVFPFIKTQKPASNTKFTTCVLMETFYSFLSCTKSLGETCCIDTKKGWGACGWEEVMRWHGGTLLPRAWGWGALFQQQRWRFPFALWNILHRNARGDPVLVPGLSQVL